MGRRLWSLGNQPSDAMTSPVLPQPPVPLRQKWWPELDGLRGTAILLVLLLHYVTNSRTHDGNFGFLYRFAQIFRLGWSGVDLFFVLSGFLIGGILLDNRSSSNYFRTFYARRAYRILPLYYGWILTCVLAHYAICKWGSPGTVALVGSSMGGGIYIAFLQNVLRAPVSTFAHYMVSPTWSLAVEEQFYLVAPLIVRYLSTRRLTQILLLCVVGAPLLRYYVFLVFPDGASKAYLLTPCRADALAMGMLAAIAWRTKVKTWLQERVLLLKIVFGILLLGLLLMIKWLPGPRNPFEAALQYSWIAFMYTSVLWIVLLDSQSLAGRLARWRFLKNCGRISYCTYLIHLGVLGACHWAFFHSLPHINDWRGLGTTILAAILTWILARASWRYLERPLIDRGHAFTYGDPEQTISVPESVLKPAETARAATKPI
jgi:peptidoglycan/LPS O-acetylase OafA/YrhL